MIKVMHIFKISIFISDAQNTSPIPFEGNLTIFHPSICQNTYKNERSLVTDNIICTSTTPVDSCRVILDVF